MEDKKEEKQYEIRIIDTYIDKKKGHIATNFGVTYKVPQEISDTRAKELINAKVAKIIKG